jgi:hypothetical protein
MTLDLSRWARLCGTGMIVLSACSLFQATPEAAVRKAAIALRQRDRRQFNGLVDVGAVESQLRQQPGAYGFVAPLGVRLETIFRSPADTSQDGLTTQHSVGMAVVGLSISGSRMGKAQQSGPTASVPVSVELDTDTVPIMVSIQLAKRDSKWRIIGIGNVEAPTRSRERRAAKARGELYPETMEERASVALMKSDLRNLATAQEAYFSEQGMYADSLPQLGEYRASTGVSVTLSAASRKGWAGSATHGSFPGAVCSIFVGVPTPMPKDANRARSEGAPFCRAAP